MIPTEAGFYWARSKDKWNDKEADLIVELTGTTPFLAIKRVHEINKDRDEDINCDPAKLVFGPKITFPSI